jgi:hypothetical protein
MRKSKMEESGWERDVDRLENAMNTKTHESIKTREIHSRLTPNAVGCHSEIRQQLV